MFVFNDQKLKMVNLWQELFYEKRIIGSQFKYTPEFDKIADAYNIKSSTFMGFLFYLSSEFVR